MVRLFMIAMVFMVSGAAHASGLYECEEVDQSKWLTEEQLTQQLVASGWQEVRRMKPGWRLLGGLRHDTRWSAC